MLVPDPSPHLQGLWRGILPRKVHVHSVCLPHHCLSAGIILEQVLQVAAWEEQGWVLLAASGDLCSCVNTGVETAGEGDGDDCALDAQSILRCDDRPIVGVQTTMRLCC